jgi:hypothetical protein
MERARISLLDQTLILSTDESFPTPFGDARRGDLQGASEVLTQEHASSRQIPRQQLPYGTGFVEF